MCTTSHGGLAYERAGPDRRRWIIGQDASSVAEMLGLVEGGGPSWRQLRDQLRELVASGRLVTGARLPTIRQLAGDLGLAPGTVARAYRELEGEGVLSTARRHGTVVSAAPPESGDPLRQAARTYATTARALGVDERTALAAVEAAYAEVP